MILIPKPAFWSIESQTWVCRVFWCVPASSLPMVVNKSSLNYCSSSDKSKRRTKTVKKSLEPKWNQTFMYSPVHRREFRERMLEITLWDQARVREEESEFLGEVQTRSTMSRQAVNLHSFVYSWLKSINKISSMEIICAWWQIANSLKLVVFLLVIWPVL